jgi:hypothetical protein|uniref:Uncharacterized protein n=1 Tax=Siphoviridae sp. ct0zh2 TaxID=2825302 RepID=A0A8S5PM17_9CAUD|nr:MAG TPA: hypothetical protein [Siphoviridae sp. ct0zh2]
MFKMVDGTGIIGVDMICPLGVSTPQPPNYDKVEVEGTGMLVLPNSLDAPLERLELGGKTEQISMTGKNLLDVDAIIDRKGINGSGEVISRTGSCVTDFIFLKPETYTFSLDNKSKDTQIAIYLYNDDKTFNKYLLSNLNETSKIIVDKNMYMIVMFNKEKSIVLNKHVMLEIGSNKTPYEPYTGGKPSPSPEYPQEIKNSGKWNEETQKYEVEVVLSGKNLFDFSTCEEGKVFEGSGNIISAANGLLTDFIPCFPNSQYSRSLTGSTVVAFYDCDKNKIGFEIVGNTTFVTPEKCRYFRFSALKTMVDYTKIVACPGQTVMDYEPYREPKFFTLTLNKPLRGIGEIKDELSESGILRRVKSITLNGSEKWYKYENSAFVAMNCYGLKIDDLEVRNYSLTTLCNFFKWARFPQDIESQAAHGGYIYFTVSKETYPDLESFKGWLAKNTPVLEYWLKEPALEELSEEDKASIRALKTYYPTTVITADGGELDPDIKVTYRKEI